MESTRMSLRYWGLLIAIFTTTSILQPIESNAQASSIDLAFCMNGSGSISPADFAVQRLGIQAALGNSQIFPRNGSIGITLVQYASNQTQVHIPYTVINTEADAQALINTVNSINQIQGCTNPGDGINTAWAQITSNGDLANNQQILCLFTDGLPNCGTNAPSAVNSAKAAGLDRFSVVAIEDPPFYFESDFKGFYGSVVFGGGAVTVASNTVEFANFVGTTCLFPNIELMGMEVNQAIQDWNNSVDLVAEKTTYVRAHIKSLDGSPIPAQVRLRAHRNGSELTGSPLTALPTSTGSPFTAQLMPDRDNWDHSINFKLPSSWTTGNVTFTAEAVGGGLICKESAGPTAEDCKTTVTFLSTDIPEIRHVRIDWTDAAGTAKPAPTTTNITELENRLRSIFPVHDFSFSTSTMSLPGMGKPDLSNVLSHLRARRKLDSSDDIYYGVFVGAPVGGLGSRPGKVSTGNMPNNQFDYGRNRHAHEVGHNLNRSHAPFCDATSSVPFPHSTIIGVDTVATIGPMASGDNALIYGLDDYLLSQNDFTRGVIDPNDNYELMSYCGTWRWISDFTYEAIRSEINTVFFAPPQNALADYMVVRGIVDLIGNIVEFDPFLELETSAASQGSPFGNYSLVMKDDAGVVLSTIPFEPEEIDADYPSTAPGKGLFILLVEKDPAITEIEVQNGGVPMGSIQGSSNKPTVAVTFPNGGEFLSTNIVDIQWTASDADSDPLTYTVQFSKDGGTSWETLIVDHPDQHYMIELSELPETTQGLIRVIASDGFHTAKDLSDGVFTTPNNAPDLIINSPANNSFFSGVQPIFFEASVNDKEENTLVGGSIVWHSNINGNLGTGKSLFLTANQLSTGVHTITATATDGGGLSDSETISLEIFLIAPPNCSAADNIAPEVECQEITVQLDATGSASITTDDVVLNSFDNCGTVNLSVFPSLFDCNMTGSQLVTVTADDGNGNITTCTQSITIEDRVMPQVFCQNLTVQLDANGSAFIAATDVDNGSNDVCGIQNYSLSKNTFGCEDIGNNQVTFIVTDNNGNQSSCPVTITIEDNDPPQVLCQNLVVELDSSGNASIAITDVDNGSNDACGIQNLSVSKSVFDCADVGDNTVKLRVIDNNSNESRCRTTVTVQDNIAPLVFCQDITLILDINGFASTTAAAVDNGSYDACGIKSFFLSQTDFSCADLGDNPVTLTVTDMNDNESTCIAIISVERGTALPVPWENTDIGQAIGEAIYEPCGEAFALSYSGINFPPSPINDEQHIVYQEFCDNVEIVARLRNNNHPWAGIVIRESLATDSKMIGLKSLGNTIDEVIRDETGSNLMQKQVSNAGHSWLRLVHIDSTYTGYTSSNGIDWVQVFNIKMVFNSCAFVGLFTESINVASTMNSVFDNVEVSVGSTINTLIRPPNQGNPAMHTAINQVPDFKLYPNPANNILNIRISKIPEQILDISILNLDGKQFYRNKINSDESSVFEIQLKPLNIPPGLYIISIQTKEGLMNKRFVKTH